MSLFSSIEAIRPDAPVVEISKISTLNTISEIKVNPSSGCFTYAEPALENRFIIWRAMGTDLYLEERSFEENLKSASVCFRFKNEIILPGTLIVESDCKVLVLVATTSCVHRVGLTSPNEFDLGCSVFASVGEQFVNHPSNWYVYNASGTPHLSACMLNAEKEALFGLADEDGSILLVTLCPYGADGAPAQDVLRHGSRLRRILVGLLHGVGSAGVEGGGQLGSSSMVDLSALYSSETSDVVLCSLSYDCQLRLWSCSRKSVIHTVDMRQCLRQFSHDDQPDWQCVCKWRLKCTAIERTWVVVLYLCIKGVDRFFVFVPSITTHHQVQLVRCIDFPAFDLEVVDFCVNDFRFIALYLQKQRLVLKWKEICLQEYEHGPWVDCEDGDVYLSGGAVSASQLMGKIFHNPLLAYQSVERALRISCGDAYTRPGDFASLRSKLFDYLEDNGVAVRVGGAGKWKESATLESTLRTVWNSCVQYHNAAMRPIGLVYLRSCRMLAVVTTDRLLFQRDTAPLVLGFVPQFTYDDHRPAADCFSLIHRLIGAGEEQFFAGVEAAKTTPWQLINDELSRVVQDASANSLWQSFHRAMLLDEVVLFQALQVLAGHLDPTVSPNGGTPSKQPASSFKLSSYGASVTAAYFASTVGESALLCRAALFLMASWCYFRPESKLPSSTWTTMHSELVPKLSLLCQCYVLLKHIGSKTIGEHCRSDWLLVADLLRKLTASSRVANLKIKTRTGEGDSHHFGKFVVDLYVHVLKMFWPTGGIGGGGCLQLLDFLLENRMYADVRRLVERVNRMPSTAVVKALRIYYDAMACLRMKEPQQAYEKFLTAFIGLVDNFNSVQGRLGFDKESFFMHTAALFDKAGFGEQAIQLCLDHLRLLETEPPDLWHMLCRLYCNSGQYAEAVQAVVKIQHQPTLEDSLTNLVRRVVDRGLGSELCNCNFGQAEQTFVGILEKMARENKPTDDTYYDMLFAHLNFKMKYRTAAHCMYEKAKRLEAEPASASTLNSQSAALYLAATALNFARPQFRYLYFNQQPITLQQLRAEALLVEGFLRVDNGKLQRRPTVDYTFEQLLRKGHLELAENLCKAYQLPMEKVASVMALNTAWDRLKQLIDRHAHKPELYHAACASLLNSRRLVPAWLIDQYKETEPVGAMVLFLEHGELEAAVQCASKLLRDRAQEQQPLLPVLELDNLYVVLEKSANLNLLETLIAELQRYSDTVLSQRQ
ncbi:Nuclear pore complex protein [Trichinella papuae]|uniref:Nuclear pore complex protein n=1 Tax=Trichinella papuae TaxID=268474 RepID=A0A0V1N4K8_9BILA|nr:Nuclear pore complex protein [Trichinella papuae]